MRRIPSYRLLKARNLAVVTIRGKDYYLGAYDSPQSWQHYHRLLLEYHDGAPAADDSRFRRSQQPDH